MKRARLLTLLALLLLAVPGLLTALWIWSGTAQSLDTALRHTARFLPAGQTLVLDAVSGSVREGGRIGTLRWQQDALSLEARDMEFAWSWRALLEGQLRLQRLHIRQLRVDDQRPARAPTPPASLVLPLGVSLPFTVETLDWRGPPALQVTQLSGLYAFDHAQHTLRLDSARLASGTYQAEGRLLARAPMTLALQLQGQVMTRLPGSRETVQVQASASAQGDLAGADALLAVQARLQPARPASAEASQAMQATVSAQVSPWQAQPVTHATADWTALDLALLWPQAPHTQLAGSARIEPQEGGWRATLTTVNRLSGPWDRARLPLDSLQAALGFTAGQWSLKTLSAQGAGGSLQAQGQWRPPSASGEPPASAASAWQGQARLQHMNPAALHSALAPGVMAGQITATQAPQGLAFDARLSGQPSSASGLQGLRLDRADARGLWQAGLLTLEALEIQTPDARLQGRLTHHLASRATQGQLSLTLPGAQADLTGRLASADGLGDLQLRVTDAALAWRWLARWPGLAAALPRAALQGSAEFTAHWQGGWQQQGRALQIGSTLRLPSLEMLPEGAPVEDTWRLSDVQAGLSGRLDALTLTLSGQAQQARLQFQGQAQASGKLAGDSAWQGRLETLQLQVLNNLRPGPWTLQLQDSLAWNWHGRPATSTLEVASGQATLTGPVAGRATLAWQPARWTREITGSGAQQATRSTWRTAGQVQGLPLAWLDLLSQTPQLANLGLRGDMELGGDWDLTASDTLKLRASLARTRGDLTLATGDGPGQDPNNFRITAGVREARLTLATEGDQLTAQLRWDSEHAGRAQADFSTRLLRQASGWAWPGEAPLTGSLRARLPQVGVWSLLAPPGWRLRGTLDANATLSGTRAAPQWRGTLQADELAVRSAVDGFEFSDGRLRASLQGQRLDISEFTLRGASGAAGQGGRLTASGFAEWLPAPGAPTPALARVRMQLNAQLESLRVSARADRRLAVSGQVQAALNDTRLTVRGALKADQALFILPDDSAPVLGSDVVVRSASGTRPANANGSPTPLKPAAGARVMPDVELTLDLGPDFQLQGRGLITRLAGTLTLRSSAPTGLQPRLTGEVRTVRGTYKAYGQRLDIEEGVLRFAGPYDNPALDILAIRPNLQQRVGVQISGTALSPRVRLYAEPDLPDTEKLAWLVLGRAAASGGAESAVLQQAALALLGGNNRGLSGGLAEALGLDELSVRGAVTSADSTTTGTTVTLGKRLSRDFYVAYEHSLAGTLGTFYIFYDLSRRFTLRAQTGEHSAVDLIFTLRYD